MTKQEMNDKFEQEWKEYVERNKPEIDTLKVEVVKPKVNNQQCVVGDIQDGAQEQEEKYSELTHTNCIYNVLSDNPKFHEHTHFRLKNPEIGIKLGYPLKEVPKELPKEEIEFQQEDIQKGKVNGGLNCYYVIQKQEQPESKNSMTGSIQQLQEQWSDQFVAGNIIGQLGYRNNWKMMGKLIPAKVTLFVNNDTEI